MVVRPKTATGTGASPRRVSVGPVEPLARISASDLCDIWRLAAGALDDHAPGIDGLDVVSGSMHDTGSNLAATMASVAAATGELGQRTDLARVAAAMSAGAAGGALGASGALLVHLLDGFAEVIRNQDHLDGLRLALALEAGADLAGSAVRRPGPGSMVTVAQAAAGAALAIADAGGALAAVADAAADAALDALERTPAVRPELAAAGVVDAGAAGWVVVLEVLGARIAGEGLAVAGDDAEGGEAWGDERGPRFEVRCQVDCDDDGGRARLEAVWSALGEEVDVTGPATGTVAAQVRTDDIGAVIEAALAVGRPHHIRVEDLFG